MRGRYMRNVLLSMLAFALIVTFLPKGSVQAAEGMCTDCNVEYRCYKGSSLLMTMNNTLDGCWWQKGLKGGCKVCDRINICAQIPSSWLDKCAKAGGSFINVYTTCYTDPVRMKAANAAYGNIQRSYLYGPFVCIPTH
jgi:hypothetical protein